MKRMIAVVMCLCMCMPVMAYAQHADEPIEVLTIYALRTYSMLFDDAIELFEVSHPEIRIDVQEMEVDSLREAIYAGNTEADLLILPSNGVSYEHLIATGRIHPLDSDILLADTKSMYPQILEYVFREEKLYGYPFYMRVQYIDLNRELFDSFGWNDIPATWDSYIEMMQHWYEQGMQGKNGCYFTISKDPKAEFMNLFAAILISYVNTYGTHADMTFDSPEFRNAIEKLRFLSAYEATHDGQEAAPVQYMFDDGILSPIRMDKSSYILPPSFSEQDVPVVNAYLDFWTISANSKHPELALEFLESLCNSPDMTDAYELYPFYVNLMEDRAEWQGLSTEVFQDYRVLMAHTSIAHSALIYALFRDGQLDNLIMEYYNGVHTTDEVICIMDDLLTKAIQSPELATK